MEILADVSEIPIQRPRKKQKDKYSGKKKDHTLKFEIGMSTDGEIIHISKVYNGKVHDFKIRQSESPFPREAKKIVDLGYLGLQKKAQNVFLPFKGSKKKSLTPEEKIHNRSLAKIRIKIEHKIRQLKIFKIIKERYRNFGKKLHMRINLIAGIVNLKSGF